MKLLGVLMLLVVMVGVAIGQARTAEKIVDVPFSQLNSGNPPNGSVRHVINGVEGTTPCTGGGSGAIAYKINGVWECPKMTPGVGTGDVLGPSASAVGELMVFGSLTGKNASRSNTLNGVVFVTNGVASALASTGSGGVVRDTAPAISNAVLTTPTIGSFVNSLHTHENVAGAGQLNASNVFSAGTIPPARIISGGIVNARCLRVSNVGAIEIAAFDCGAGGGGTPGGSPGNLTYNEAGTFGALTNTVYDSPTGRLTLSQKANGNDTLNLQRFTDTSPTGTLFRARNTANNADLFAVNANGSLFASSSLTLALIAAPSTPAAGNTVVWADSTTKNLRAQDDAGNVSGTVRAITCSGTDKISSISSAGVPTCTADQGGAGTGVITFNTLNTSDQTVATVDDTNIDIDWASAVSTHTLTVAWVGRLDAARMDINTVLNDTSNTWTTGAQDFGSVASLKVPSATGASPSANGLVAYDLTSFTLEYGENGTNRVVVNTAGSQTLGNKTLDNSNVANLRDTLFTLQDNTDSTKTVNFVLDNLGSSTNRLVTIPNANSVTVIPTTATTNQFVTHIDSNGVVQKAQPSFANLSGSIGVTQGGTGLTSTAQGDIFYADTTNSIARLPKSTTATHALLNTGASNNPQWGQVPLATGVTGTLPDANLSANVTVLGSSIDLSGAEATGVLAAGRFPALTGDVTTTAGNLATTIASDAVSNAKLANMATATFKGRTTAGTGDPEDLTGTQATALLNTFTTTLKGLVPAPGATTNAFLRDDGTWVVPSGAGDMVLASVQTVTGAKTFDPAKLIVGGQSATPTAVAGAFYRDTDDTKLYWAIDGSTWGEVFVSGISVVNLASANVTGVLPVANGGTGFSDTTYSGNAHKLATTTGTLTSGRCVEIDASGNFIQAAAACGTGGGGTPGGADTNVQINDAGAFFGEAAFSYNKTTNTLSVETISLTGTGAGYLQLAPGTAPTVVASQYIYAAPATAPGGGLLYLLPSDTPTNGEQLTANISGTTVTLSWDAAGSGGSGDAVSVNGSAATDANFVATTASGTVPSITWALDTGATPDAVSIATVGAASATEAGVITTGAQTLAGKKTFSPAGADSGLNVGSIAGDPSSPTNGDLWYDSIANELTARINGVSVALGAGGGGGANTALSNLASVAINTALISDTNNTDDLGTSSLRWKDIYAMSLDLGGSGGGYVQLTEGTQPSLVANTVQHTVATDVPAGGVQYLWGSVAASSGLVRVANSSGVMTVTQDGGVSHLASSTSADLRGVLSDESGTGAAIFAGGNIGVGSATTPAANDNTTLIATTAYVQTELGAYAADTKTLTNTTIDPEATGNAVGFLATPDFPAAGCSNTTASSFWDLPTTTPAVAACVTGTNTQKAYLDFADTSGGFSAQTGFRLPPDFTGTMDARITWLTTATSGNVKWSLSTICVATDATETDDPAFNTASTVTTAAPGVASRLQTSLITSVTITGCAAGEWMHVRIFRDGNDAADTISATARLAGIQLLLRRTQ